jgi:lipid-binding SYLF domain-containing protein
MSQSFFVKWGLALAVCALCLGEASAFSKPELESAARGALSKVYSRNPEAAALGPRCLAVLVFPDAHMVGLGLAIQSGTGVLFFQNTPAAYFNLTGISAGLELGVQKFNYAIFFEDRAALDELYRWGGFECGLAPTLVVADGIFSGKLSTTSVRSGIHPFLFGQQGLMISLGMGKNKLTEYAPRE